MLSTLIIISARTSWIYIIARSWWVIASYHTPKFIGLNFWFCFITGYTVWIGLTMHCSYPMFTLTYTWKVLSHVIRKTNSLGINLHILRLTRYVDAAWACPSSAPAAAPCPFVSWVEACATDKPNAKQETIARFITVFFIISSLISNLTRIVEWGWNVLHSYKLYCYYIKCANNHHGSKPIYKLTISIKQYLLN